MSAAAADDKVDVLGAIMVSSINVTIRVLPCRSCSALTSVHRVSGIR
jgi:hypothetical protein